MESKQTLKYTIGRERDIVLEKDSFADSIFQDQYAQTLRIANTLVKSKNNSFLKCIAFCGDRGEGKTSCLTTAVEILRNCSDQESAAYKFVSDLGCMDVLNTRFSITDMIDPSFFDDKHNILELIIGILYNSYKKIADDGIINIAQRNELLESFSQVNSSLLSMKEDPFEGMNDLHRLSILSATVTLRQQIEELIKNYLSCSRSSMLVIPIDDIDLSMTHAYKMCEQIRKYLCVPGCMVLLSLKMEQIQDVVEDSILLNIKGRSGIIDDKNLIKSESAEMAKKYINKLIPISSRVEMPKAYEMINLKLEIEENGKTTIKGNVKHGIVEMIFQRTRYLFYNPSDSISPIVPNNLRELQNLIALLVSMEPIRDSRDESKKHVLENNKNIFKLYFFTVWKSRFDEDTQRDLDRLINFDYGTSFNKEVIAILNKNFEGQLKKNYHTLREEDYFETDQLPENQSKSNQPEVENQMILSIISSETFGYNVTAGDLFYLFPFLEGEMLSERDYALLFFLKSLYSIKMYEAYDQITEHSGAIYPEGNEMARGIEIIDQRFNHSNKLQQLTGGSYFTYCPGDLIPKTEDGELDLRIINGKKLNEQIAKIKSQFEEIKNLYDKEDKTEEDRDKITEFNVRLNVVEFFILTIRCGVPQKQLEKGLSPVKFIMNYMRKNVEPFHFKPFYKNTGYYLFDIMAIFGNIINVEFAYKKFSTIDDNFYKFIFDYQESLLHKVIATCKGERSYVNHGEDSDWTSLHSLLSVAAIRNAEVLMSVRNGVVFRRNTTHDGGWRVFKELFDSIQKSDMCTHKATEKDNPDEITFKFIKPILDFISGVRLDRNLQQEDNIVDENDRNELLNKIFYSIFLWEKPSSDKPTIDEIMKWLGRRENIEGLRKRLKKMPYFEKSTEEELKSWIPDIAEGVYPRDRQALRDAITEQYMTIIDGLNNPNE